MLHFEGDRDFSQPPADLWARLGDARFLAGCVPGSEAVTAADADRAECVLRPGFSFVRGSLEVTLQVADRVGGQSLRLLLHGKGIGSSSDIEATLALTAGEAGGTRVHWTADVKELGGLLKAVPRGLVQAAAQKVIADAWEAAVQKLAG
jgi:carbon monoxide dehydrogenase subunit G